MATHQRYMRFLAPHTHLASPFGPGWFGRIAESVALFFGTPWYLIGQSLAVVAWIAINGAGFTHFDPYPYILLNLAFSTQAAYAAPLILLAQTRQADRDKSWSAADAEHREDLANTTLQLVQQNADLILQVKRLSEKVEVLTTEIHHHIMAGPGQAAPDPAG